MKPDTDFSLFVQKCVCLQCTLESNKNAISRNEDDPIS